MIIRYLALPVALTIFAIGVYYVVFFPVRPYHAELKQQISASRQSIVELADRVEYASVSNSSTALPSDLLWKAKSGGEAALKLQEKLLGLARANRIIILTFGTVPTSKETGRGTAAVALEGEASLHSLYLFLNDLDKLAPRVANETLRIRSRQFPTAEINGAGVYFQTTIWIYWENDR